MENLLDYLQNDPGSDSEIVVRLISALLLVAVGFLVAMLGRFVTKRFMILILRLVSARYPVAAVGTSRIHRITVGVLPQIVFWSILLIFLAFGTELLGLTIFTAWMSRVLDFVPSILTAALIILAGVWIGIVLKENVSRMAMAARLPYARLLGGICQTGIVVGVVVIAASQLGIDISFILVISGIVLGASLLSIALAFGLGATKMVSNIISCHYVRGLYRVGNTIEINDVKGKIIKITGTFIIVETERGQVSVPANVFSETKSTLLE